MDIERRLNRIEGLLTQLLIDAKVSEKTAERALALATELSIEVKAKAQSTHTREFINQDAYQATFGELKPDDYGPNPTPRPVPFQNGELSLVQTDEELEAAMFDEYEA